MVVLRFGYQLLKLAHLKFSQEIMHLIESIDVPDTKKHGATRGGMHYDSTK